MGERAAFDQLNAEYKKLEKELTDTYYETSNQIEKEILAKKQQIEDISKIHISAIEAKLKHLVEDEELNLSNEVIAAMDQPIRSK